MRHINYFKNFSLNETSKYKSPFGIPFIKMFTKICNHYPQESHEITADFKDKLFQYVSKDESKKFPINFYDKEFKTLKDLIHELDYKNSLILLHKSSKNKTELSLPDLKPVWTDEKNKIYVYRANTAFEAITLGKGTNMCISVDYKNGRNWFYDYLYDNNYKKKASIYFVKSLNQSPFFTTLAIDIKEDGGYLYTDVRNKDKKYTSYEEMVNNEYTSPDLDLIPKEVFKPFNHNITKEEFLAFPFLINLLDKKISKDEMQLIKENFPTKYDSLLLYSHYMANQSEKTKNIFISSRQNTCIEQMYLRKAFNGYVSVLNMNSQKCGLYFKDIEGLLDYTYLNYLIFIKKRLPQNDQLNEEIEKYLNKNKHLFSSKWINILSQDTYSILL